MAEAVMRARGRAQQLGAFLMVIGLVAVLFSAFAPNVGADHSTAGPKVSPTFIPHGTGPGEDQNPTCDEYEGAGQEWDSISTSGSFQGAVGTTITVSNDDVKIIITITGSAGGNEVKTITFESVDPDGSGSKVAQSIDAVVIKAGSGGHNLYRYDPPSEVFHDDGLTSPQTSGNAISHISFCYDIETASTTTTTQATTTTTQATTTTTQATTTTTQATTTTTQATTTTTRPSTPCCFVEPTTTTTEAPTTTTSAAVLGTVVEETTTVPPTTQPAPATTLAVKGVTLARTGSESQQMLLVAGIALLLGGAAILSSDFLPGGAKARK